MITIDDNSPHRMRQQKALDFYHACRNVMQADRTARLTEARVVQKALEMEAPRYYVTDEYAQKVVHRMLKGRMEISAYGPKADQWREIMQKVRHVRSTLGVRTEEAVWRVLESKASSYFVSPEQAYRLYLRGKNLMRNNNRKEAI
ncbi:MAG: hypothetical protein K2O88_01975 [Paramuribaculum sp.]|nr:hypothetical protein [Paramuribaculum sp.]